MEKTIIAVVGGGIMGNGIAEVFATAGHLVYLYDVSPELREKALDDLADRLQRKRIRGKLVESVSDIMQRVRTVNTLDELSSAELVIEAVVERIDVKQDIFSKLDRICSPTAILATNTSSLSITEIASVVQHPERVVGMHFFNPAPVMRLVEVVSGRFTDSAVVEKIVQIATAVGKLPIRVTDTPGFVVNRVARPFYLEALRIAGAQVASVQAIDHIIKAAGFKMGPFELQDLIGIDVNYAVTVSVYESYFQEPRFRPHGLQRSMVQSKKLGKKTGGGYYTYDR
ncbi:3-hydroxyacyl-CoA dehydrogenase NAD-binding domain-containing protein [Sulfoacidibacillus thermotolerans]|uniref:3-hydroxybutyryl-CoA dehydrogenase n=1 Tax=Sulfoacidibacillus thermotolerans TaxID=1765684 RepID=A0A2U3D768_SULT2|nr:3-hydroxyacyl-CoA dehydrogenase NAD-binding domain-containing protein [Sulfoacidibacillus thermotolerans]PWI57117.1 3-hydroxybutyryl-CoA dehydrogenase [Sulfoacidibacillus thermotolerans]